MLQRLCMWMVRGRVPVALLCIVSGLYLSCNVYADDAITERFAPKEPGQDERKSHDNLLLKDSEPAATEAGNSQVLVDELKGINLLSSAAGAPSARGGIVTQDLALPPLSEAALLAVANRYIGQGISIAVLDDISLQLMSLYRQRDILAVNVFAIPGQDISDGYVDFRVLLGKVAKRHWNDEPDAPELSQIKTSSGEALLRSTLENDLSWLNRNPYRYARVGLRPGARSGDTDINFNVEDLRPWNVNAGYENSGSEATDKNRWFVGVNGGRLWGSDHYGSYRYTQSPDGEKVQAHSASYTVPLDWQHEFNFTASHVYSRPSSVLAGLQQRGEVVQGALEYSIPFLSSASLSRELSLSYQYKRSNNNLEFGGTTIANDYTDVSQFVAAYDEYLNRQDLNRSWGVSLFYSPGDMTPDNDTAAFSQSRANARARYTYAQAYGSIGRRISEQGAELYARIRLQAADGNLISSEQLGVGGSSSVRGYRPFVAVGDQGGVLQLEARLKPFQFIASGAFKDQFRPLVFFDYARVSQKVKLPNEGRGQALASTGLAFNYSINRAFNLSVSHGLQLAKLKNSNNLGRRTHVAATLFF